MEELKKTAEGYVRFLANLGDSYAGTVALAKMQESVWWAEKCIQEKNMNPVTDVPKTN